MADYDLTDEDQIKQYLSNIETEYSYQCLAENEPDGCHRLADFMETVKNEPSLGAKLFKKNCDENKFAHSCFKYAGKRMLGVGVDIDGSEGVQYFERACEYGFGRGCSNAGMVYLEGKRVEKDLEKGLRYLSKACDMERGEACSAIGTRYLTGKHGLSKDIQRAKLLLGRGCDLGSISGCVNLSRMYRIGDGVKRNDSLAEKYKQEALRLKQSQDGLGKEGISLGRTT